MAKTSSNRPGKKGKVTSKPKKDFKGVASAASAKKKQASLPQSKKNQNKKNKNAALSLIGPIGGLSRKQSWKQQKSSKQKGGDSFTYVLPLSLPPVDKRTSKNKKNKRKKSQSAAECLREFAELQREEQDEEEFGYQNRSSPSTSPSKRKNDSQHRYSIASSNSNKSNHSKNSKNDFQESRKRPRPAGRKPFRLPNFRNAPNCKIPWWTRQDRREALTVRQEEQRKFDAQRRQEGKQQACPSVLTPHYMFGSTYHTPTHRAFLSQLDQEMTRFADYVRLTPAETAARNYFVQQIQHLCRNNLQTDRGGTARDVRLQVFGSFATPPVCAFYSDVDMAIWGVVPPDDDGEDQEEQQEFGCQDHQHHDGIEDKIQKWREVLDEFVTQQEQEERAGALTASSGEADEEPGKPAKKRRKLSNDYVDQHQNADVQYDDGIDELGKDSTNGATLPSALDQLLDGNNDAPDFSPQPRSRTSSSVEVESKLEHHKGSQPDEQPRRQEGTAGVAPQGPVELNGDICGEARDVNKNCQLHIRNQSSQSCTKPEMGATTIHPSQNDDLFVIDRCGGESSGDGATCSTQTASAAVPPKSKKSRWDESDDDETGRAETTNNGRLDNAPGDSDSEEDTADKLASLYARQAAAELKKENPVFREDEHVISLSSSNSSAGSEGLNDDEDVVGVENCTDKDDNVYGECDLSVSFVNAPRRGIPSFGPTGRTRVRVVNALTSLGSILRRRRYTQKVDVIRKARVPIVKVTTYLGFEGDIAMGGHNGTDTSQYAMKQVSRFKSYAVVVLVLKILLVQHNLDTPFTGGLGSFKLYVLVAHHLERHVALGGTDRPGEVLLSFLLRYSKVNRGLGRTVSNTIAPTSRVGGTAAVPERTNLTTEAVLRCDGGYSADLSAVYLLDHCNELFQRCWGKLSKKYDAYGNTTDMRTSFLVDLFDAEKLLDDRNLCLEKASNLSRYDKTRQFGKECTENKD